MDTQNTQNPLVKEGLTGQVQVKAVKHADIRGKELLYVVITRGEDQLIISVGEKTYQGVKALTEGKKLSTVTTP